MIRVLFLTHTLDVGGAEIQLALLAPRLRREGFEIGVLCFHPGGQLEEELRAAGVFIDTVSGRHRRGAVSFLIRLTRAVRRFRPDVIYSYMSLPNVIAALVCPLVSAAKIVWGMRASYVDLGARSFSWRMFTWLEARLAWRADLVICNSHAGRAHALERGFPVDKTVVVPNGIDAARFAPNPGARMRVRAEFGIADDELLIGLVARVDSLKDHLTFLRAAALRAREDPASRFVCVGGGDADKVTRMQDAARSLGIADRVIWTGHRDDVPALLNAFDINTLSSIGEGFPNVIGEAMASGVVCVATDVGDSARLLGKCGRIIPSRDPRALANAWAQVGALSAAARSDLGKASRARILEHFPPEAMVAMTAASLERVVEIGPGETRPRSSMR